MHRCVLYGLVLESDVPLPGLPPPTGAPADVHIHFSRQPPLDVHAGPPAREFYRSPTGPESVPSLVAERLGEVLRLRYSEGIRFHLRDDGSEVWCDWEPPLTTADAVTFLLGPVLGLVLRRRGILAVHASAVVHDGRAWAFVGPGGSGKSTIALALARTGLPVLTEDVLALRPADVGWLAWPAYDHLRLWSDSPVLSVEDAASLPALSPTWPKRAVALDSAGLARARDPVTVAGFFLLEATDFGGPQAPAAARVEPLRGAGALLTLIENSYMNYLLDGTARAAELLALGKAVQGVQTHRLTVATGSAGLDLTVLAVRRIMEGASATK